MGGVGICCEIGSAGPSVEQLACSPKVSAVISLSVFVICAALSTSES